MAGHVRSRSQTGNNILNNLVKHIWHGWRPSENYEAEQRAPRRFSAAGYQEWESAISLGFTGINRNAPFYLINYATGRLTHTHVLEPVSSPIFDILSLSFFDWDPTTGSAREHFVFSLAGSNAHGVQSLGLGITCAFIFHLNSLRCSPFPSRGTFVWFSGNTISHWFNRNPNKSISLQARLPNRILDFTHILYWVGGAPLLTSKFLAKFNKKFGCDRLHF